MTDILAKEEPVAAEAIKVTAEAIEVPSEPTPYPLQFTGTAGEYFRIWIVNTFLTIITLGIYAAWAKVRTRQYFYAHTRLAGQPFEYLADPKAILRGNLIIGGAFLLYTALGHYNPMLAGIIVILFYLFLPFLIYKTLRFYAHNSSFRNIRFRFLGTVGESYKIYLVFPFYITLTLGLIIPHWFFRQKKYFFDNFAFGTTKNYFNGLSGHFYKIYIIVSLIGIALFAILGTGISAMIQNFSSSYEGTGSDIRMLIPLIMFCVIIVASTVIQQYIYARINNYCWENSRLGNIRFQSTLKAGELMWIRLSNIVAIICSAGLLIPWAKVRGARYILNHLTVITQGSLDDFTGAASIEDSAIGDVATDIFDIEIGL